MSDNNFILETKEYLVNQYQYPRELIQTDYRINTGRGLIKVDLLIKNREGNPYIIVMTDESNKTRDEMKRSLIKILIKTNVNLGVYRYKKENEIPGFIGLSKEDCPLSEKPNFIELNDYPNLKMCWPELLINIVPDFLAGL